MSERNDDEQDAGSDPVRDYYAAKKKRYLAQLRGDAPGITTGTPHDRDEAAGYAQPHDARSADRDED